VKGSDKAGHVAREGWESCAAWDRKANESLRVRLNSDLQNIALAGAG
jgi:hypothetical protein